MLKDAVLHQGHDPGERPVEPFPDGGAVLVHFLSPPGPLLPMLFEVPEDRLLIEVFIAKLARHCSSDRFPAGPALPRDRHDGHVISPLPSGPFPGPPGAARSPRAISPPFSPSTGPRVSPPR